MLQWTQGYRHLFKIIISFSLGKYPEVELLDHMIFLFLIFWGSFILFSIVAVSTYISTNSTQEFPFFYMVTNNLLFFVFLIIDILTGCKVVSHCGFDLQIPLFSFEMIPTFIIFFSSSLALLLLPVCHFNHFS